MSIGRFFKSLVNNEVMGEEIISFNVKAYNLSKQTEPNLKPIDWLSAAYMGRMRARRQETLPALSYLFCENISHIPEPHNARALGLLMLKEERSDIWSSFSKFELELLSIFGKYGFVDDEDKTKTKTKIKTKNIDPKTQTKIKKRQFVCPSCGSESRIPNGKEGIITCPICHSKTPVNKDSSVKDKISKVTKGQSVKSDGSAKEIDREELDKAAKRYAKQKEENLKHLSRTIENHAPRISEPSKKPTGISIEWLRENAEHFERKKAKGREISDYEQRLIDQYQAALRENRADGADVDGKELLRRQWEKNLQEEVSQKASASKGITVVGIGGGADANSLMLFVKFRSMIRIGLRSIKLLIGYPTFPARIRSLSIQTIRIRTKSSY